MLEIGWWFGIGNACRHLFFNATYDTDGTLWHAIPEYTSSQKVISGAHQMLWNTHLMRYPLSEQKQRFGRSGFIDDPCNSGPSKQLESFGIDKNNSVHYHQTNTYVHSTRLSEWEARYHSLVKRKILETWSRKMTPESNESQIWSKNKLSNINLTLHPKNFGN